PHSQPGPGRPEPPLSEPWRVADVARADPRARADGGQGRTWRGHHGLREPFASDGPDDGRPAAKADGAADAVRFDALGSVAQAVPQSAGHAPLPGALG